MRFPLSTGQVARLLNTTEPKIAEEVRRGRVVPAPPVVAGRRLWSMDDVLHVAGRLDVLTDDLRRALGHEAEGEPTCSPDERGELRCGPAATEVRHAGR